MKCPYCTHWFFWYPHVCWSIAPWNPRILVVKSQFDLQITLPFLGDIKFGLYHLYPGYPIIYIFFTTLTFINPFPSHPKEFITCPINMPMVTPIITPIILPLFRRPPKMPIPVQNFRQTDTRGSIAGCKPTKMELYTEETLAFIGYHADIMRCIIIYYICTELNIQMYIYIYVITLESWYFMIQWTRRRDILSRCENHTWAPNWWCLWWSLAARGHPREILTPVTRQLLLGIILLCLKYQ